MAKALAIGLVPANPAWSVSLMYVPGSVHSGNTTFKDFGARTGDVGSADGGINDLED